MFSNDDNVECRVSANILLAAAQRLFSYDKVPLAMALVKIVLDQHPEHSGALRLRDLFAGDSAAEQERVFHLYCDFDKGVYYVGEKGAPGTVVFPNLEEAEKYLRKLK